MFKLSPENSLAIKITLISLLLLVGIIGGVLWMQYSFSQKDTIVRFEKTAKEYITSLRKTHIFSDNINIESIRSLAMDTFDKKGNSLDQAIIVTPNKEFFFSEYTHSISKQEKEEIQQMPLKKTILSHIGMDDFYLYGEIIEGYKVFYFEYKASLWGYYNDLFYIARFGIVIIFIILYIVSLYFARISIRPIHEHNIALESYNRNLAHEMKTPLAVIRGDLEMLEITGNKDFIDSSREELKNIEQLIESLLFLAKPQNTNMPTTSLSINSLIQSCIAKYKHLHVDFCKNTDIHKNVDEDLFCTMIQNLVHNAIKYGTGNVTLRTQSDRIIIQNSIDTPLTKKELSQLTELFYQADTSRNTQGYGLGLPMVQKIVELFGWKMRIESKNLTFIVTIIMR